MKVLDIDNLMIFGINLLCFRYRCLFVFVPFLLAFMCLLLLIVLMSIEALIKQTSMHAMTA